MSLEPKFKIGDTVFQARAGQEQIWITCPECLGDGRLRVILGDESQVSIECECCARGYEGSPGRISTYQFRADTREVVITGVDSNIHEGHLRTRYNYVGGCSAEECDLFGTRGQAAIRALQLQADHETEETNRIRYKKNQSKTWAWHVSYYRKQIRDAQETIRRATAHLNVIPKKGEVLPQDDPGATITGRAETGGKGKYGE